MKGADTLLDDKVCIVTGGNSGIGREVAAGLMEKGAHVVLACRSMSKCEEAKAALDARGLLGTCECSHLDLLDYESIRSFAARTRESLQKQKKNLDVLVNNAGVLWGKVENGEDMVLRSNHLGPFLLTRLSMSLLARDARIINVASNAHRHGWLTVQGDQIVGTPWTGLTQYGRSKLCNVLFTSELQRRLRERGSSISAYSLTPGFVKTNIFESGWTANPIARWLTSKAGKTPEQGAKTVLYAATTADFGTDGALFLNDEKVETPSAAARDPELARGLWIASQKLVGLQPGEDPFFGMD